ncbi:tetratricopeptide repeat protein [Geotalea daltonii]|nr:tetratricopeptide repeat protein [Geotalea daltonii]
MGAVSYPNSNVIDFVTSRMIPLQVPADGQVAKDFRVGWTPTIVVLDLYGKEHQRTIGFLPPEELVPSLLLGLGKADFDNGDYNDAILRFNEVLSSHRNSGAAPEALYLTGVSRYKTSHNAGNLKETYQRLAAEYPASEWVKRASPYNLL